MTCICGIEKRGEVWMGGDSAATGGDGSQMLIGDKKVFIRDHIVFGICGIPKTMDVLNHVIESFPKQNDGTDRRFVSAELIPFIKKEFKKAELTQEHPQHGSLFEGEILIGYRGKLYKMESNFQIVTNMHGFDSVGSGARTALGSLQGSTSMFNAKKRIEKALKAAALNDSAVRPPFNIIKLPKHKTFF